jgi:hypothetical protein
MLLFSIIFDCYWGPQTPLILAFLRGLYIAIILDCYVEPKTPLYSLS